MLFRTSRGRSRGLVGAVVVIGDDHWIGAPSTVPPKSSTAICAAVALPFPVSSE
jgi:hypothetical protein